MSTRYLTNVLLALVGGFLLVTSQAFGRGTYSWLMLGAGIAALAVACSGIAFPSRGIGQRALDAMAIGLGVWTIVASMVFTGVTLEWLGFASGAGMVTLALIGLTLHELRTERVVHSLEGPALRESTHDRAGSALSSA